MITINMEMPKSCLECPMYNNYNYYCTLYSFGIPARHNRDGSTRPEWCELEELPKCEDAVSRQEVIEICEKAISLWDGQLGTGALMAVKESIQSLPPAQPEIKPIEYRDCANAMLRMWMDNVVTDGEYNRIMDKLNAHWRMENGRSNQ